MSRPAFDRLEEAIYQVQGWAAVLDVLHYHLQENANSSMTMASKVLPQDYISGRTFHMLTNRESEALGFVLYGAIQAAEELGEAWGEYPT